MWYITIFFLFTILSVAYTIKVRLKIRERAYKIARQECNNSQVQLLDDSIQLIRSYFKRLNGLRFIKVSLFSFEYSTNFVERNEGFIEIRGNSSYRVIYKDQQRLGDNVVNINSYRKNSS